MTAEHRTESSRGGEHSTTQTMREQTRNLGHDTAEMGGHLAHSAREQGGRIAAEAGHQAHDLLGTARQQLRTQTNEQQRRAASGLRHLGDELRQMAERSGQQNGLAGELAGQAATRLNDVAGWLEREPGSMLDDVREYARRHPGMFLAGAVLLGGLVGRLTRNAAPSTGRGQRHEGYDPYADGHRGDGHAYRGGYEYRGDGPLYRQGEMESPERMGPVSGFETTRRMRYDVPDHELYDLDEPYPNEPYPGPQPGRGRRGER
jgi:hypothetical protein